MDYFASFTHFMAPRVQGRCLHQLVDILALSLCGTLVGCEDLLEVCEYGRARLVRGHWAIQNQLYWQPDLTFKENPSRLRTGHAALKANILRKTALCRLAQAPHSISLKPKCKQATYDND